MMVRSEDLLNVLFLQDDDARAVRETPFLVGTATIKFPPFCQKYRIGGDDAKIWQRSETFD